MKRYVLLGNHRDAWVYGAADPSSGTATLLEIARSFGALKNLVPSYLFSPLCIMKDLIRKFQRDGHQIER